MGRGCLALLLCCGPAAAVAAQAAEVGVRPERVAQLGDPLPPNPAAASEIVQGCQIFANEQSLKGAAYRDSIKACIDQERPSLGIWRNCLHRGLAKKLHGASLDSYVSVCSSGSP